MFKQTVLAVVIVSAMALPAAAHAQTSQQLEEILASSYKGKVIVSENIYPGVKIIIKQAVLHVRDTINSTVFYEQEGEIQIGVYG